MPGFPCDQNRARRSSLVQGEQRFLVARSVGLAGTEKGAQSIVGARVVRRQSGVVVAVAVEQVVKTAAPIAVGGREWFLKARQGGWVSVVFEPEARQPAANLQ